VSETVRLYYSDPGASVSESEVLEIRESDQGSKVILGSTVFYPEGGGQPCDLGFIGGSKVLAVAEEGQIIVHSVEGKPSFAVGDTVALAIDKGRRRDHTQQHSGQHLLSAILEREYGIHTLGFHLGSAYSTIDVSCPEMDKALMERIEAVAEDLIIRDIPYAIHVCPPEDPASFPLRKKLPEGESLIRIVEIGGYDWVACCGTHVKSASVLRMLNILYTERYKGNTRVYFVAGDRAVNRMKTQSNLLGNIAGSLGTSAEEAPSRVSMMLARLEEVEADRSGIVRERALLEIDCALMRADTTASGEKRRLLSFTYEDRNSESALETARAGASRGSTTIAISIPDMTVCVMTPQQAASKPSMSGGEEASGKPLLGSTLKPLLQEFGGRGGGGANNFRAVFESGEKARLFAAKAASLIN